MHLFNAHPVLPDNCIDGLHKDRGGVSCGKPAADSIHLRVHEFEAASGSFGVTCTAMVTGADGFGDQCGMPPMHEVHGNLPVRRLVKLWMQDGTTRYGEIGDVLDRIERLVPPAHTPAETRTGTPDTTAAIGAEVEAIKRSVVTVRTMISDITVLQMAYAGELLTEALAALDRVEAWAPERATSTALSAQGHPLWLTTTGAVVASPAGHPEWRALYVQAGR